MEKSSWDQTGAGNDKGGSFANDNTHLGTSSGDTAPADVIDTNAEEAYWRQNFSTRPYVVEGNSLSSTGPHIATAPMPTAVTQASRLNRRNLSYATTGIDSKARPA